MDAAADLLVLAPPGRRYRCRRHANREPAAASSGASAPSGHGPDAVPSPAGTIPAEAANSATVIYNLVFN